MILRLHLQLGCVSNIEIEVYHEVYHCKLTASFQNVVIRRISCFKLLHS